MSWYRHLWEKIRPLDARDEGLAAGTGALMGSVAEQAVTDVQICPTCGRNAAVVEALDLVDKVAHNVCTQCNHRWNDHRVTVQAPR